MPYWFGVQGSKFYNEIEDDFMKFSKSQFLAKFSYSCRREEMGALVFVQVCSGPCGCHDIGCHKVVTCHDCFEGVCLVLRASSGKHARLVGVCPAGGDFDSAASADLFFLRSLLRRLDVSTSGQIVLKSSLLPQK